MTTSYICRALTAPKKYVINSEDTSSLRHALSNPPLPILPIMQWDPCSVWYFKLFKEPCSARCPRTLSGTCFPNCSPITQTQFSIQVYPWRLSHALLYWQASLTWCARQQWLNWLPKGCMKWFSYQCGINIWAEKWKFGELKVSRNLGKW